MSRNDHTDQVIARKQRRAFLWEAAAAVPILYGASTAMSSAQTRRSVLGADPHGFPGVITRQTRPINAEFPFPTLNTFLTPTNQFYIRTHFEVPDLQANQWKLKVEGHVEQPFEVSYEELRSMPAQSVTSILECSGNGRIFLKPPQIGIRWEQGGVGNAEWTGVPLSALLDRAGVKAGGVEVILEGHDQGEFKAPDPATPGKIRYARSLPLEKARRPEVLLAYGMNGEDLPREYGHPVRAVVAGWYGMASVKWLRRIIVTDLPFHGFFQTFAYTVWERRHGGLPSIVPVTEIGVKAQIARPTLQEVVAAGSTYRVFGAAWSGESEIESVEVSTDAGKSWSKARLDAPSIPFSWRFFEYEWQVPTQAGMQTLMARATDARGQVQPLERDQDRRDAVITHVQPIQVHVK